MLAPGLLHGWGGSGGRSEAKLGIRTRGADVSGPFQMSGVVDVGLLAAATYADFNPGNLQECSVLRITPNGFYVILTGLRAGRPGQLLIVENVDGGSGYPLILQTENNDQSSAAPNRFMLGAYPFLVRPSQALLLYYDETATNPAVANVAPGRWKTVDRARQDMDFIGLPSGSAAPVIRGPNNSGLSFYCNGGNFMLQALDDTGANTVGSIGQALVSDGNSAVRYRDVDPDQHYHHAR